MVTRKIIEELFFLSNEHIRTEVSLFYLFSVFLFMKLQLRRCSVDVVSFSTLKSPLVLIIVILRQLHAVLRFVFMIDEF